MQIYHNSRDDKFRNPKGAVRAGAVIKLSVAVSAQSMPQGVTLRLWEGYEKLIPMLPEGKTEEGYIYSAEVTAPETPGLLWYYFIIQAEGKTVFYSNNEKRLGGVGEQTDFPTDISYQITVFDKSFKTPDWFKGAIMYQIFPDRFFRASGVESIKKGSYRIHSDWYEPIFFDPHPYENGPACNDFYGGNLKGIMEKLDYLKDLGISVIYLNPIFEAFSNHRYDTGDYSKVDPLLGSEDDFKELCKLAEDKGIRIILDGVFSHTGSDSVYFNKYKTYGDGVGASQNYESPYKNWFQWNEDGSYNSWWGCSNLPNVNELEPTYVDYILTGKDAIIKKWLSLGAYGWRLDVADELPDEFIKILRREVKAEKRDAVVIGEVWEDASNKVSYGCEREYLFGWELDSVMNYPFKDGVIGFLMGHITAKDFAERMESINENYPKEVLYSNMNLLGTHDTQRIKTVLGGQYISDTLSRDEKAKFKLDPQKETLAIQRLKLAAFMQMTFVGVPCIYYGDEIGMQGLSDPFNRMPYTWRCVDVELLEYYKKLAKLRNTMDCIKTGEFKILYADRGVLIYQRYINDKKDVFGLEAQNGMVLCVINSNAEPCEVEIELDQDFPAEIKGYLKGEIIQIENRKRIKFSLPRFSAEGFMA